MAQQAQAGPFWHSDPASCGRLSRSYARNGHTGNSSSTGCHLDDGTELCYLAVQGDRRDLLSVWGLGHQGHSIQLDAANVVLPSHVLGAAMRPTIRRLA